MIKYGVRKMKWWLPAVVVYVVLCIIGALSPASEEYDVLSWKLYLAQFVAIPAALLVFAVMFFWHKRKQRSA